MSSETTAPASWAMSTRPRDREASVLTPSALPASPSGCCSTAVRRDCCAPEQKESCCGAAADAGTCGCQP
jgi:hypothetical protein